MPQVVGKAVTVVQAGGLRIDEVAGNVATTDDRLSIAYVTVDEPAEEPWLTLAYDEWLVVRRGQLELHYHQPDGTAAVLHVSAGETCFVARGERFKPVFRVCPTEYIPVCLPAFRPDRCKREEDEGDVARTLAKLHGTAAATANAESSNAATSAAVPHMLYHMCQASRWEHHVASRTAYYPPTFADDGHFTHATCVPSRLLETANHFYTATPGQWICLELDRQALHAVGIITKDEAGMPVGEAAVSDGWSEWICPHIYGGIPTLPSLKVVTKIWPMTRDATGAFTGIDGLVQ